MGKITFFQRVKGKKYKQIVIAMLSLLVVLQTISSLTFNVETMTGTRKELSCSAGAHTHDDSCYNEDGELVCGYADYLIRGSRQ